MTRLRSPKPSGRHNGWLLQSLLNDESIEEIAINGLDEVCVSQTESDEPDHPPASATSPPIGPRLGRG